MPAISIVVPMYNVRRYIERCLQSLLNQTFTNFQVVCIDDGSTDDTLVFAKSVVVGDKRFEFLAQENAGQSCARNNALRQASGEYVLFLDADDYYEPETLSALYKQAEADELDVLFFSASTVYESSKVRALYQDEYLAREDIDGCMTGRQLFVQFSNTDSFCVSPAMQLLRRDFLEGCDIRFPEGIIHEDNLFTCLVLAHAQRAAFLNEPLYVRTIRDGSTMTSMKNIQHIYGHFKCAFELEAWLRSKGLASANDFKRALMHHIAFCYDMAAFDALSVEEEALEAQASSLDANEELSFRLHVIEHMKETRGIRKEYVDSTTYKIGSAIMAIPCWIKDRVKRLQGLQGIGKAD